MVKADFSTAYWAKKKRIQRLPKLMDGYFMSQAKKNAIKLIDIFRDGIIKNNFSLEPLKPKTIMAKVRQGLPKPSNPLFGLGDTLEKKSYLNMMRIRKLKKGYKVFPSWGKHHKSGLSLRALFYVHENGAIIKQFRGGKEILIRIPPRPAFRKAYQRLLRQLQKTEPTRDVIDAMKQLVGTGNMSKLNKLSKLTTKDRRYDETSS